MIVDFRKGLRKPARLAAALALAAALVPLGAAAVEAGTKDAATDGYTRMWTFSSGGGEYDPMVSVVEAGEGGAALYAKHNLYDGGVLEFGKIGPTGAVLWKRADLTFYEFALTEDYIVASIHTGDADDRKETVVRIDKKDGSVDSRFLLESIGVDRLERFTADRDRIYIADGNRLLAVSYTGQVLWKKVWNEYPGLDVPMKYEPPVAVGKDMLLTWTSCSMSRMCGYMEDSDFQLTALSPETGDALWTANERVSSGYVPSPAPGADRIVLENAFDGKTFAYALADGTKLWEYRVDDEDVWASIDSGVRDPDGYTYLNFIESTAESYATTRITALDADGAVAWDAPWNVGAIVNLLGMSPDGSVLYFESGGMATPSVYAVDRRTGERLASESYRRPGGTTRSLADLNDGLFAYGTDAGFVTKDQWFADGDDWVFADWRHKAALSTRNGAAVGSLMYRGNIKIEVAPDQTAYLSDAHTITAYAPQRKTASVAVNGRFPALPQPALVRGGFTYVPVRGVLEQAGATVEWRGAERKVVVTKPGKTVELRIDAAQATVNGAAVRLEAPAIMVGGSTMLPLRFLVETLDGAVTWDGATRTAWIETQ